MKGSKVIQWTDDGEEKRQKLFRILEQNREFYHPDYSKPFIISTDASNVAIGDCLKQEEKVIALYSKKLMGSEMNYSIVEKEFYAVLKGLERFRKIIYGAEVEIHTDSKNVANLNFNVNQLLKRWRILLGEYNCRLKHIPGNQNQFSDYLSRNHLARANLTGRTSLEKTFAEFTFLLKKSEKENGKWVIPTEKKGDLSN